MDLYKEELESLLTLNFRYLQTISLTIIIVLVALAGILPAEAGSYVFRGISGTEGLTDLMVSALYKDKAGYVWIGTATAVERFDGVRLRVYPPADEADKIRWVNTITETAGHGILIGCENGLWQVDEGVIKPFLPETVKGMAVRAICTDAGGTLYIAGSKGLILYKGGKADFLQLAKNNFSPANDVVGMLIDNRGLLWLSTHQGLYSVRISDRSIHYHHNTLFKNEGDIEYRTMARIGTTLYLGTMRAGIIAFNTVTGSFTRYMDFDARPILSLGADGRSHLYVGTDGNGAYFITAATKQITAHIRNEQGNKESLRSNSVYSLLVDRDGLVWVGLYQFGLDYTIHQNDIFALYRTPFFTSDGIPVRALSITGDKKIIGSRNGLYYIDERTRRSTRIQSPVLRSNIITSLYRSGSDLYVGTYQGGMYVMNTVTMVLSDFVSGPARPFIGGSIYCINTDAKGNLWVCTSSGLFRFNGRTPVAGYTPSNSALPGESVFSIYFDSAGNGWIATDNGLCLWDASSAKLRTDIFPKDFIQKEKITSIYEDSDHTLYFLPHKGDIWVSDPAMKNYHRLTGNSPLRGKNVVFIVEDQDKWLWIGTNNGLYPL